MSATDTPPPDAASDTGLEHCEPYRLDDQVGYRLRLASQRHAALFQARMSEGLTPTQLAVLVRLGEEGPCAQNQLGRLAHLDVATVKGVVDRLAAKDLVTFSADARDHRRRVVALSERGKALLPTLHALGLEISRATLAPLDRSERAVLLSLLAKIG